MKFLHSVKGCTRKRRLYNEDICKELKIFNIHDCIVENKESLIPCLNRLQVGRLSKEVWL